MVEEQFNYIGKNSLRILVVGDNQKDSNLVVNQLETAGYDLTWNQTETREDLIRQLDGSHDLVIADDRLSQLPVLEVVDLIKRKNYILPVIVINTDEGTAMRYLDLGVADCLMDAHPDRVVFAVKNLIENKNLSENYRIALEALRASEERYRGVAETEHTGLSIADQDEIITYANAAFSKMVGYSPADLLGMPLTELFPPNEYQAIIKQTDLRKKGISSQYETIMISKNGEKRTVIISGSPITSETNEYLGSQAMITDITDRKKAEIQLAASEERLRLMINNSPLGFIATNLNGQIIDHNSVVSDLLGYSKDELLAKHFEEISHHDDQERNQILFQQLVNGEIESFDLEKRFIHKNGQIIHGLIRSQIVRNHEGDPLFEYALIEDISDRKKAEEKITHLNLILYTLGKINHLIVREKNREKLIQETCNILTENRGYVNAWIILLDEESKYYVSAESGMGEEFNSLKPRLESGYLPKCAVQSLEDDQLKCIDNPAAVCEGCPLSENLAGRYGFSIRLHYENNVYGLITVSTPQFVMESKEEQDLFTEIAENIGFALHNIEISIQKKYSDEQLRLQSLALESAANAILITDAEGHIDWANEAFEKLTGFSLDEVRGENPRLLKSNRNPESLYKNLWDTISRGEIWHGEIVNKKRDGEHYTEEMTIAPLVSRDNQISNYVAIKQDITKRVQAREDIKQHTADLQLINSINMAINRGTDLEEILKILTTELVQVFNSANAGIYLYNPDKEYLELQNKDLAPGVYRRLEKLLGIKIPDVRLPITEGSFTQELLFSETPRLINDPDLIQKWMLEFTNIVDLPKRIKKLARALIPKIYKVVNIDSVIAVPMVSAGELIGLMDFSRKEPFTEKELERVSSVVRQVTVALSSMRTEKQKSRSQKLLLALSQAAPSIQKANSAEDVYRAVGDEILKMGLNVTVFTLTQDKKHLAVSYHSLTDLAKKIEKMTGLSSDGYHFPLKPGGFFNRIIREKTATYSHMDIDPISEALPELLRPIVPKIMDLFSRQQSIVAPLVVDGAAHGLIAFSGMDLSESDVPAINTFAHHAAIALEKARLYNETKEMAAFNKSIVQSMTEGIVLEDTEGRFTFVNPATEHMLGMPFEEWVGKRWRDIVPRDQHHLIPSSNGNGRKDVTRFELDLQDKNKESISLLVGRSPRYDSNDVYVGEIGVFTNITESKKASEEIEQHVQRLEALRIIDQAIMGSYDINVTLNVIIEQVMVQLNVDAVAVLRYIDNLQSLQYTQGSGFRTFAIQETDLRVGEGYAGKVALKKESVFIPDLSSDEGLIQQNSQFNKESFVSYYGIPLIAKGSVVGVLEIFNRTKLNPAKDWVSYLRLLATQIAIAIDNITLFDDLQRSNIDLTLAYDATIEGWAHALELKDMETVGHSRRVVDLTMAVAKKMGIRDQKLSHIRRGALLHDIGKMGIPDVILQKSGPLTEDDWIIMKKHPVYAFKWLSTIQYLQPALDIPYAHHEHWDGTGYPRGLKGDQIPIAARIFAVVDVWDALNSDRPYRKAWPREEVIKEIRNQSGKQFDPAVVNVFLDHVGNQKR